MGKYVSIGQLRQQTGRAFASLKTYMDKSVRDPIMSVAMQAKALADSVVQRANAGEFNGARGPQGVPGPRGADGAQGQDGRQGEPGLTVTAAEINGSGHLVVHLSDGSSIDAGDAKGETGPQGPKGETGATGQQGIQGVPGQDGADGQDGHSPVVQAVRHPQLPITVIYVDGVQQAIIRDGATGPKGDTGDTGPQGSPGIPGTPGADGQDGHSPVVEAVRHPQLPMTFIYVDGVQQATILDGATGPQGPQGPLGPQGHVGPQGEPGSGMEVAVGYLDFPLVPNTRYALGYVDSQLRFVFPDYAETGDVIEIGWENDGYGVIYEGPCYPEAQFDESYLYCQLRAVFDAYTWWISKSGATEEY